MRIVVVGGGISGLACAFHLKQLGFNALLLESSERVGGVIETVRVEAETPSASAQASFLFELGPQSVLSSDALLQLVAKLGLEDSLLKADPRAPRYIYLRGRLHPVPMAPSTLLTTSLLGAGSKLRLLAEPFRKSQPPEMDESIAGFVRRKFGGELLDHLVGPFVSGVYAGDPARLSLRSAFPAVHRFEQEYGSVIRGAMKSRPPKDTPRPTLCALRDGLGALPRALQEQLGNSIHTGVQVETVRRGKTNGSTHFEIHARIGDRPETLTADVVVLATPALATGRVLSALSRQFQELLSRIEYAAVAVVSAGYGREQVRHPLTGFGFLVPRKEGKRLLGTVWSSSLFPGRAPEGMVSLATFAGGATDPALFELSDDEIASIVEKENAEILQISGTPVARLVHRWPQAIAQYNLGHGATLSELRAEVARFPGLFLTGSYFDGPSVPSCIEHALRTAEAVQSHVATVQPGLARGAGQ